MMGTRSSSAHHSGSSTPNPSVSDEPPEFPALITVEEVFGKTDPSVQLSAAVRVFRRSVVIARQTIRDADITFQTDSSPITRRQYSRHLQQHIKLLENPPNDILDGDIDRLCETLLDLRRVLGTIEETDDNANAASHAQTADPNRLTPAQEETYKQLSLSAETIESLNTQIAELRLRMEDEQARYSTLKASLPSEPPRAIPTARSHHQIYAELQEARKRAEAPKTTTAAAAAVQNSSVSLPKSSKPLSGQRSIRDDSKLNYFVDKFEPGYRSGYSRSSQRSGANSEQRRKAAEKAGSPQPQPQPEPTENRVNSAPYTVDVSAMKPSLRKRFIFPYIPKHACIFCGEMHWNHICTKFPNLADRSNVFEARRVCRNCGRFKKNDHKCDPTPSCKWPHCAKQHPSGICPVAPYPITKEVVEQYKKVISAIHKEAANDYYDE